MTKIRPTFLTLLSHRTGATWGMIFKFPVGKPTPRFKGLFKAHAIFLILSGWVNLSHRNWLPCEAFSISCFGSSQGKLPPFLYFGIFNFSSRSGSIEIAWRYLGHFLFEPYYLSDLDESMLIRPLISLPALGKEFFLTASTAKWLVGILRKNHSFFCLGVGFSLYNPVQYFSNYFFFF